MIIFSDGQEMLLYELIQPLQRMMQERPMVIFIQACRGKFNEAFADEIAMFDGPGMKYHLLRDCFFLYSSPVGNRSWRPKSSQHGVIEPSTPFF